MKGFKAFAVCGRAGVIKGTYSKLACDGALEAGGADCVGTCRENERETVGLVVGVGTERTGETLGRHYWEWWDNRIGSLVCCCLNRVWMGGNLV